MPKSRCFAGIGTALCATLAMTDMAASAETVRYIYDARGRLIRVERTGSVNNNVETKYELDRAGNRTRVTSTGKV